MSLDFIEAVKHIESFENKTFKEDITVGDHKYTFVVGLPSLETNIVTTTIIKDLKEQVDTLKLDSKEKEQLANQLDFYMSIGDLMFIKELYIDNNKIDKNPVKLTFLNYLH
jgi:hypothetical protein